VQVMYNMIDLAIINAWVLYQEVTGKPVERRNFMLTLADELRRDYMEMCGVSRDVPAVPGPAPASTSTDSRRLWCQIAKCKNNKSKQRCVVCYKVVCGSCTAEVSKTVVCVLCKP